MAQRSKEGAQFIAQVAVDGAAYHFDKLYDYLVPESIQHAALPGCRVLVPFGGGNRRRQGIVFSVCSNTGENIEKLKPLYAVLDEHPLLTEEMLRLACWMKERFFCTFAEAVGCMLPLGLHYRVVPVYRAAALTLEQRQALQEEQKRIFDYIAQLGRPVQADQLATALGIAAESDILAQMVRAGWLLQEESAVRRVKDATVRMLRPVVREEGQTLPKLSAKQSEVYQLICSVGQVSVKEACYYTGVTVSVVEALVKKGLAEYFEEETYRQPTLGFSSQEAARLGDVCLTREQQTAYEAICRQYATKESGVALLYGVTGSGKTSVFLRLIDEVSSQGRGVIMMVPEISLTPQMIALFRERYGDKVAVFHSALSLGERLDEWKRVRNGQACIAVGTRSAVFAPLSDVGLIVMDEEQEYTYKSESSPRYHARDVAKYRCHAHGGLLLLASATPSVESYQAALSGRYSLYKLLHRYGAAQLPEVIVADRNEDLAEGNTGSFGDILLAALRENLEKGCQSILLLNRRGYHTFVSCRACGEVLTCPNCSISMTYHAANGRLMCHYCGYSIPFAEECPHCHEEQLRYAGSGTQKAEEELESLLPQARILRMDTDVTMSRYAYEEKLSQFGQGKYDIMIGTQMVAKGLNFPRVTLVGVLSVDQALYNEDFRSYERAFDLLTQVVGRSGRGDQLGRAVIQTFTPENPIIRLAAAQDYEGFFAAEIQLRRAMLYPPFADLCVIGFVGSDEKKTAAAARAFFQMFTQLAGTEYAGLPLRVMGPSSAAVAKVSNKFRYRLIIKCRNSKPLRQMLARLLVDYGKKREFAEVKAFADFNPDMIL
ncbi:MAG TPA: primosomal protein N' [Candidatus Gallacutalibacter stercoravium]|nr:primosomal protein N' [Candidatus Gallacutalibacter stercoravium]